jgi:endogenous inhibitor of DNA gyrase (YacG/DUF329 family)
MGMFDYITVKCPNCHKQINDQIKVGYCSMHLFNLDIPISLDEAHQIQGHIIQCRHCFTKFEICGDLPTYKIHMQLKEVK